MKAILFISEMNRGFGWNLVRSLFSTLDQVVFWLFGGVMKLLYDIAGIMTAEGTDFSSLYNDIYYRVYMIVAIYMLFKVTFSILTYVINPDSLTDKSQGAGKLVMRIIISLILLISFPRISEEMMTIQGHIIQDNTIDNIITGKKGASIDMETKGKVIAASIYNGTFISRNDGTITEADGVTEDLCYEDDGATKCIPSVGELQNHINDEDPASSEKYKFNYMPLVGTAIGVVITLLALGMCIDIATRTFKIIILFAIAPIPIMSYIDPKASKDGAFSKWTKLLIGTYIELFVRLAVISLMVLLIQQITSGNTALGATNGLVKIALVIALLFFAKDAPKFICDAIGVKMPEGGAFSGIGKIAAAGALGLGAIGSGISGFRSSRLADEANGHDHNFLNTMKNVGAGLFGVGGGLAAGAHAGINAKDHNGRAVMDALAKRNSTALAAGTEGSTFLGRALSTATGLGFGETIASRNKRSIASIGSQIKEKQAHQNALKNIKSRVSSEMVKQDWTRGKATGLTNTAGDALDGTINYKDFMAKKNAAAAAGQSAFMISLFDNNGNEYRDEITMEDAEKYQGLILKNNEDFYLKSIVDGDRNDTVLRGQLDEAAAYGLEVTDRSSVNDTIDTLQGDIDTLTREKAEKEKANEHYIQNDRFSGKS